MPLLHVPQEKRTIASPERIADYLLACKVKFEQWSPKEKIPLDAPSETILEAYENEISILMKKGGYKTADVVQLHPQTPGLEAMLAKFNKEHWHEEDEVRFTIFGHGLFHIRPSEGPVISIQVEAGDLLCLPQGILHWFDLCQDRQIRTIRLFQDPQGWTPYYSESKTEQQFEPLCLGLSYFPFQKAGFDHAG